MAATLTVPQHTQQRNFIQIKPHSGVVTLHGYGISVRVERGHLILEDGVGPVRKTGAGGPNAAPVSSGGLPGLFRAARVGVAGSPHIEPSYA